MIEFLLSIKSLLLAVHIGSVVVGLGASLLQIKRYSGVRSAIVWTMALAMTASGFGLFIPNGQTLGHDVYFKIKLVASAALLILGIALEVRRSAKFKLLEVKKAEQSLDPDEQN